MQSSKDTFDLLLTFFVWQNRVSTGCKRGWRRHHGPDNELQPEPVPPQCARHTVSVALPESHWCPAVWRVQRRDVDTSLVPLRRVERRRRAERDFDHAAPHNPALQRQRLSSYATKQTHRVGRQLFRTKQEQLCAVIRRPHGRTR